MNHKRSLSEMVGSAPMVTSSLDVGEYALHHNIDLAAEVRRQVLQEFSHNVTQLSRYTLTEELFPRLGRQGSRRFTVSAVVLHPTDFCRLMNEAYQSGRRGENASEELKALRRAVALPC